MLCRGVGTTGYAIEWGTVYGHRNYFYFGIISLPFWVGSSQLEDAEEQQKSWAGNKRYNMNLRKSFGGR